MNLNRRTFLAGGAAAFAILPARSFASGKRTIDDAALEKAAAQPVLKLDDLKAPVIIESIELLRKDREYFIRVRSKDGAEGVALDNARDRKSTRLNSSHSQISYAV